MQLIEHGDDEFLALSHTRAFIKLVEEVSEPLVTQDLNLANYPSLTSHVTAIRKEGRNQTAHYIGNVNDLTMQYNNAMKFLQQDLRYLFENLYPSVRKSLLSRIRSESGTEYPIHLAKMKGFVVPANKQDILISDVSSLLSMSSIESEDDQTKVGARVKRNKPLPKGKGASVLQEYLRVDISSIEDHIVELLANEDRDIDSTSDLIINGSRPTDEKLIIALENLKEQNVSPSSSRF